MFTQTFRTCGDKEERGRPKLKKKRGRGKRSREPSKCELLIVSKGNTSHPFSGDLNPRPENSGSNWVGKVLIVKNDI